jgi:hypothetical protein
VPRAAFGGWSIERRDARRVSETLASVTAVKCDQAVERYIASHESAWKNPNHRQQWRNTGMVVQVLEPIFQTGRRAAIPGAG